MTKIARIHNGKIVYTDDAAPAVKPNEMQARSDRQATRDKHRRDMLQRNEVDYYRVHKDQIKNLDEGTQRLIS